MKKVLLLIFAQMLLVTAIWAQRSISGRVTDDQGTPLGNVSVTIKGTKTGTVTTSNGNYTITVPASTNTLVFSYLDKETRELTIGNNTQINVELKSVDKALDEVVVTGYIVQRKKDIASAISKISAADLENLPMPNFVQAMQGRAAGVAVSASNGIPGGSLSVIIRGPGSISAATTPLYVVDGIQLNTSVGSINTQNNPLNFLNPDDIESIEILKDAAAASIYGAKSANGVVLITTKKGKLGKPKFTFNIYNGQSSALRILPVTNTQQFLELRIEALVNSGNSLASATTTALNGIGVPANLTKAQIDSLPNYDWQGAAFGTGTIFNVEASISGGSPNVSYRSSASYSKQTAFIKPTDFQRAAFLTNLSYKINEKVTIDNSISISTFSQIAPYQTGGTGFGNNAYSAGQMLTINPIYNPDGTYYGLPGSGQTIVGGLSHNIIAVSDFVKYFTRTSQFIGSASLSYKVIPELTLKTFVSLDYRLTQDHRYRNRVNDGFATGGSLSDQSDWNTNILTNTIANFRKTIKSNHNINALGGIEYRRDVNEWFQADATGFPTYLLQYLNAASTPVSVGGAWSGNANFSQFGKLSYNFKSKYVIGYTIRRDGSSKFGANNKFGVFQSAQVAWNADQESFIKNIRAISTFKLRYSFGQGGNDLIPNTQYAQLYGATRLYGGASGLFPSQLGNPDLKWETREENNVGLDFGLFKNRILLVVDAYRKVNKDLLLSRSLYTTTGFSSVQQNVGSMENKGLEILISGSPFDGVFKWTSSFNIAFQRNKLLELYDGLQSLPGDASIRVGYPFGSFFTSQWAGVNPATGRAMWYDKNGNYTYRPVAADNKIIGNIYPTHYGGWNNNFSFKGFSLEAFFQYEFGRIRSEGQFQQMMRNGSVNNNAMLYGYQTRWTTPGQITPTPRPAVNQIDYNSVSWNSGTRHIFKTDYIRLKQLTAGYDLPSSLTKRFKLESARFYVQGINLWTETAWPGYDPEFTGSNQGIIPQSKNITVGFQVKF